MSRTVDELRSEIKNTGQVRIPKHSVREIASQLSLFFVLAVAGLVILATQPNPLGKWMLSTTFLISAFIVLCLFLRDWRRQLVVTEESLSHRGSTPIPWVEIEQISTPAARSILSVGVTSKGLQQYYGWPVSDDDLSDEEHGIVWNLPSDLSDSEMKFLREMQKWSRTEVAGRDRDAQRRMESRIAARR